MSLQPSDDPQVSVYPEDGPAFRFAKVDGERALASAEITALGHDKDSARLSAAQQRPTETALQPTTNKQQQPALVLGNSQYPSTAWTNVSPDTIPPMGSFYVLDRTHVRISKQQPLAADLESLLTRLQAVFGHLSLQVQYESTGNVAATCVSLDQVHFTVSVFANTEQWIVEVSRQSGDGISFCCLARQILKACTSNELKVAPTAAKVSVKDTNVLYERLVRQADMDHAPISAMDNQMAAQQAVEQVQRLLSADRYDAQRLGLESLCHLTTPGLSHPTALDYTATSLLHLQLPTVVQTMSALASTETSEQVDRSLAMHKDHGYLALVALSNAMQVTTVSTLSQSLEEHDWVSQLLQIYANNRQNLHIQYYVLKALMALCRVDNVKSQLVHVLQVSGPTMSCHPNQHAALQEVTMELLSVLQQRA